MQTVFSIPWVLFMIRIVLLLIIPGFLLIIPSEGGNAGYAFWWGGIVYIAFLIVHWRDLIRDVPSVMTYVFGGAIFVWGLCFASWGLGKAIYGLPNAVVDFVYPSVSVGINEMLLAFYMIMAIGHFLIEGILIRRAR